MFSTIANVWLQTAEIVSTAFNLESKVCLIISSWQQHVQELFGLVALGVTGWIDFITGTVLTVYLFSIVLISLTFYVCCYLIFNVAGASKETGLTDRFQLNQVGATKSFTALCFLCHL